MPARGGTAAVAILICAGRAVEERASAQGPGRKGEAGPGGCERHRTRQARSGRQQSDEGPARRVRGLDRRA